ncbi:MAG TPA: MFS transporter [Candidatus Deferrimicrobium sp.]|nr:MFS transporter [Candidatus Deferrimicrobium sp.]
MPNLENTWYRRLLFMTVYMVESIITLTTLSLFPLIVTDLGLDARLYGVFGSISLLPMVFKFLIGPLSDRFPIPFLRGRRRGYIILGAILNCVFLPFLSLNPTIFLALFFLCWFFQTSGVATMDVLTDALAVGSVKSIQNVKGRTGASLWMFLGVFLGGLFVLPFVTVFDTHTLNPSAPIDQTILMVLIIISIIGLIPLLLFIFLKEDTPAPEQLSVLADWKRNLRRPFVRMGLLFAFLLFIDAGLTELTLEPYLYTEFGLLKVEVVGSLWLISLLGTVLAFLGYFFIDRIQKNRLLIIINAIYILPSLLLGIFILSSMITFPLFLLLYGVFAFISGLSYVTYVGLFFDLSDPKAAGTMIALFLSIGNLGMVVGIAIGGFLASSMGVIYVVIAVICGLRLLPLRKIQMDEVEKTFYTED